MVLLGGDFVTQYVYVSVCVCVRKKERDRERQTCDWLKTIPDG